MTVKRDRCPQCQSPEVHHLYYGMVTSDAYEGLEPWEHQMGCLVEDHDRICEACNHKWSSRQLRAGFDRP